MRTVSKATILTAICFAAWPTPTLAGTATAPVVQAPGRIFQTIRLFAGDPIHYAEQLEPGLKTVDNAQFVRAMAGTLRLTVHPDAIASPNGPMRATVKINPAFSGNLSTVRAHTLEGVQVHNHRDESPLTADLVYGVAVGRGVMPNDLTSHDPIAVYRQGVANPIGAIVVDEKEGSLAYGMVVGGSVKVRLFVADAAGKFLAATGQDKSPFDSK